MIEIGSGVVAVKFFKYLTLFIRILWGSDFFALKPLFLPHEFI